MLKKIVQMPVRFPKATIITALVITALFAWFIPDLKFSTSVDDFFMEGDPDKEFFEEVKRVFGHDGVTVVAMKAPKGEDLFTRSRMEKLSRVTDAIENIDGVRKVVSLTSVDRIYGSGMSINVEPLMEDVPENDEEWAALEGAISENPMYERNIVGPDRTTAAINVFLNDFDDREYRYYEIMDEITAVLNSETGPEKFYVSGIAVTSTATNRSLMRDLEKFLPLTMILIVIVLAASFRTLRGVVLPFATVTMGAVWTVGFMGMAGIPMSMVTVVLPPLILAIGNAYSIHVMSEYISELREDSDRSEVVSSTVEKVGPPMLICGLTTVIGFSALGLNRIPSIQDLGLAASLGVAFSVILSISVVPAALALLPIPSRLEEEKGEERPGLLDDFLGKLAEFDLRHPLFILVAFLVLALAGVLGAFRMKVDTDFLSFFDEDDQVTIANDFQQRHLAGAAPFFVVLSSNEAGVFKDPAVLRKMDIFQTWMTEEVEGIDLTMAITDYVKLLSKVFHRNDPASFRIPDTQKEVAQLFLFYSFSGDPEDFAPYVNGDYSSANIMVRSRIVGSIRTAEAIDNIERYADGLFGEDVSVKVTGTIPMVNKSANEVATGQVKGILACLAVIFVVMTVLFTSPRVGLLAMIPNVLPILALFGVMGYTGTPLTFSTSLIACIAIGLGVDDTIHIMSRYNSELKESVDPDEAVRRTVKTLGKPVIYTTVSLFLGFTIIAGSDFIPIRQFGALTGMVVLVCLVADLVMLPALVSTVRVRTLWDYVDLRMGRQSGADTRLFKGLSPPQVKVATLMSVFGFYSEGEEIVKKGELTRDLYVVLQGAVKAVGDGGRMVEEGNEFGCVPGDEPSRSEVTWQAVRDSKVLLVNDMALERLRSSHPRIADKIKKNIEDLR